MQVKIIMQKENENTIASAISNCLENNAKKAYFLLKNCSTISSFAQNMIQEDTLFRRWVLKAARRC